MYKCYQLQPAIPYLRKNKKKKINYTFFFVLFFFYSSTPRFTTSDKQKRCRKFFALCKCYVYVFDKLSDVYIIIIVTFV